MPRTTLFRRLVQQRHLTAYDAFAAQFERAAAKLAELDGDPRLATLRVSSRQFDRWLGGELLTLPRPDTCRALEYLLGSPASELFSATDDLGAHSAPLLQVPTTTPPSAPLPTREEDDDPLAIVTRAQQLTGSNADEETLAFIDSSLESISAHYEQDGPHALRREVRRIRRLAHTLLDGRQPPRVRRELFRLAARASGLLGYMAVNLGDFELAEAYCTEALDLSKEIGDLDTELWASGTLSFALYYAGFYDKADARAAAGVERGPNSAQSIRLLVNGRARALARTGNRRTAEHAIGQALDLSDRHDVPVGLTSCISFAPYGRARTLANAVTARVSLHDTAKALGDADRIDDLVEHSDSAWSRALVRLDVSTALLRQRTPDLEHAMTLGREAIRLCGATPIRSVWQRSNELFQQAGAWRTHPSVSEYGDELRVWSAQPAALAMASRSRAV
ncbi:tetratricopeptide repeat protein [Streptomyces sp. NPDC051643]|uniref:tetratricopeptide repeat protein n=1 Tax=Streptomyces sp. NPDC051643 TaxID=3365665 RepID=UPI0037B7FF10